MKVKRVTGVRIVVDVIDDQGEPHSFGAHTLVPEEIWTGSYQTPAGRLRTIVDRLNDAVVDEVFPADRKAS